MIKKTTVDTYEDLVLDTVVSKGLSQRISNSNIDPSSTLAVTGDVMAPSWNLVSHEEQSVYDRPREFGFLNISLSRFLSAVCVLPLAVATG